MVDAGTVTAALGATKKAIDWLGVAKLGGDLLSGFMPAIGAGLSFWQQEHMLDKIFGFQERMSNTAHQREVADLIKAGINPLYTATGGSGASTPMGSTGSQTDFANAFTAGIGNAMARRMQREQIRSMQFDNAKKAQDVAAGVQTVANMQKQNAYLDKQIAGYDKELTARIKLMSDQGFAALASGAASSAQASYTQTLKIGRELENYILNLKKQYGDNHPIVRGFGYFLEHSGLGAAFSGLGAGFGAGIGSAAGQRIGQPKVPPSNPVGFRTN